MNRPLEDESAKFRRRKEPHDKYMVARNGDWLFAPLQCERCWFLDIFGREPAFETNPRDQRTFSLMRRANLDMLWSRESSTINTNMTRVKELIKMWRGRDGVFPFPEITKWPVVENGLDMSTAMSMLEKSLEKGKNADYTQYDTCRKIRSTISNMYAATASANSESLTYKARTGAVFHSAPNPMQTAFMERFCQGMKTRMPEAKNRNMALMGPVVKGLLDLIECEMTFTTRERRRLLTMVGGYIAVTYTYSLRGNEGFWVDGDRLREGIKIGKSAEPIPHVLLPVIGFFKSESGERMHVFSLANKTQSGIEVRLWLERVVEVLTKENKRFCPAFCDEEGFMLQSADVEQIMHPLLIELQGRRDLEQHLPPGIDVSKFYKCDRSFRRGAVSTAASNGVPEETRNFVHRWSSFETNRGKLPGFNMMQHYADGERTRPLQLKFTAAV